MNKASSESAWFSQGPLKQDSTDKNEHLFGQFLTAYFNPWTSQKRRKSCGSFFGTHSFLYCPGSVVPVLFKFVLKRNQIEDNTSWHTKISLLWSFKFFEASSSFIFFDKNTLREKNDVD
jgi:hypothetical protein